MNKHTSTSNTSTPRTSTSKPNALKAEQIRYGHSLMSEALQTMRTLGMLERDAQRMPFEHLGVEVEFRKHVESLDCKSNAYTLLHTIVENVAINAGDDCIKATHLLTVFGSK